MPIAYATMAPAAEPRPGPTITPWAFAQLTVVGHDEEVAAELHLADHAAFVVGLPQHFERRLAVVPAFQAFLDLLQEQRRLVPAFRTVEIAA